MRKTKTLKAVALSLGLAALMAPATLQSARESESFNFTNGNFGESDPAPLGGGIAILMGLGLGYVALKKKED